MRHRAADSAVPAGCTWPLWLPTTHVPARAATRTLCASLSARSDATGLATRPASRPNRLIKITSVFTRWKLKLTSAANGVMAGCRRSFWFQGSVRFSPLFCWNTNRNRSQPEVISGKIDGTRQISLIPVQCEKTCRRTLKWFKKEDSHAPFTAGIWVK